LPGPRPEAKLQVDEHHLDFEKPIVELQAKLEELRKHPETHSLGVSFEEEVSLIEKKLEEPSAKSFRTSAPGTASKLRAIQAAFYP